MKDSCNRGMWVAGGIALLCLAVAGFAGAHVYFASTVSAYAIPAGYAAAVGAIGAAFGR